MPDQRLPLATTCWIVTDGKAGDETQCLAIAERLGLSAQLRRVAPRAPWTWLMPWGPIDPREGPGRPESPIAPPFPDLLIASGRRAVPYLRAVRRGSRGRCFTVFLKDPRTGARTADLVWVPAHDRLRGANVVSSLTSPHRLSPERLTAAARTAPVAISALRRPRVAVLLGGDSRHHRFTPDDIATFNADLARLAASGVGLMATASRRTPAALRAGVFELIRQSGGYCWDGTGDNPYVAMLATSDAVVVTADSVNMISEAAATGRPVLLFEPTWAGRPNKRIASFIQAMTDHGAARIFSGRLESYAYEPLDSSSVIAAAVADAYSRRHGALPTRRASPPPARKAAP